MVEYDTHMPSWNIHTAHVERLFALHDPAELGIEDPNAFLFGNYVPDVYVGYMVPGVSMHVDYCITHVAKISMIPVSNADFFWNQNIAYRMPKSPSTRSLLLGTWAHLVADRFFNGTFRTFWAENDIPLGDALRVGKQADFDLFGRGLGISSYVEETPQLIQAAYDFNPYRILANDLHRAIETANNITREGGALPVCPTGYQLLNEEWLRGVFEACNERLETWLLAWQRLVRDGRPVLARDVRDEAGLAPAMPDSPDWMQERIR